MSVTNESSTIPPPIPIKWINLRKVSIQTEAEPIYHIPTFSGESIQVRRVNVGLNLLRYLQDKPLEDTGEIINLEALWPLLTR
jgi:hypothetical protein